MIGRTNAGGGVSLKNAYAIITVTYPSGSMLTCSNGTKTLKAGDKTGGWVFGVPSDGEWTLIAVKDGQTTSATVSIAERGQVVPVNLKFSLFLSEVSLAYTKGRDTSVTQSSTGVFTVKNSPSMDVYQYFTFTTNITTLLRSHFPDAKQVYIEPVEQTGNLGMRLKKKTTDSTTSQGYIATLPAAVTVSDLPTESYVGTGNGDNLSATFTDIRFEQVE